eukprot:gene11132-12303_t
MVAMWISNAVVLQCYKIATSYVGAKMCCCALMAKRCNVTGSLEKPVRRTSARTSMCGSVAKDISDHLKIAEHLFTGSATANMARFTFLLIVAVVVKVIIANESERAAFDDIININEKVPTLFEGDIVRTRSLDIDIANMEYAAKTGISKFDAIRNGAWRGGVIPYTFARNFSVAYNFKKYRPGQASTLGASYDKQSIMHYGNYAFSKNRQMTIISRSNRNERLGQRRGFSKIDIQQLNAYYKCRGTKPNPRPTTSKCTDGFIFCKSLTGYCRHAWVMKNCRKSCRRCSTTTRPKPRPKPKPSCSNKHRNCSNWARRGYCRSRNAAYRGTGLFSNQSDLRETEMGAFHMILVAIFALQVVLAAKEEKKTAFEEILQINNAAQRRFADAKLMPVLFEGDIVRTRSLDIDISNMKYAAEKGISKFDAITNGAWRGKVIPYTFARSFSEYICNFMKIIS